MIYAIGDSFTEGCELPGQNFGIPGKGAWPEVLGNLLNKPVTNLGRSASGNTRIVKRALDCAIDDADGIIICWTSHNRTEFADNIGIYDVWPGRSPNWWLTTVSGSEHRIELVKYLTNHHNQEHYYANWIRQIILVQQLCKSKNIPCAMFNAFTLSKDYDKFVRNEKIKKLINEVDLSLFVNNTLKESVVEWVYGTPKGPGGHPLELGHQIIANKVYEYIRHLGWVS